MFALAEIIASHTLVHGMRTKLAIFAALFVLGQLGSTASAEGTETQDTAGEAFATEVPAQRLTFEERIDQTVDKLASAKNRDHAEDIEAQLALLFDQLEGPTLELLLEWSRQAADEENFVLALDLAETAVANFPDSAAARYQAAVMLSAIGRDQRALSRLTELLSDEPRFVFAYNGISSILATFNWRREALEVIRLGLSVSPKSKMLNTLLEQLQNGFEREI